MRPRAGYRTRRSGLRPLTGGERLTLRPTPPQSTRQPDSVKSVWRRTRLPGCHELCESTTTTVGAQAAQLFSREQICFSGFVKKQISSLDGRGTHEEAQNLVESGNGDAS